MDVFLVRHGEAAASWGESPDPGLSELGWQQAELAADALQPLLTPDTQLVSSPLLRARETAQPLARRLGLDVAIDPVFREVPSPVPLEQRQAWLREFMQQQWSEQGEDLTRWRHAAYDAVMSFTTPTVVCTHFLVLNAVAGVIEDCADVLHFWPDNGSVTHLRRNGDSLELVQLGEQIKTHVN
ncbi:MAG: histidine phosphatase family protein [Halioglobus sp.]|nr:histidine phosphatase family protein [Halioglobus sp.]